MRKVLLTGMSGTGKSTALGELSRRRFQVVDTDEPAGPIGLSVKADMSGGGIGSASF